MTRKLLAAAALLLPLLILGCSESTKPTSDADRGGTWAEGTLDPGAGTFLLKSLTVPMPGDGRLVPVDLVGSNLTVDPAGQQVTLDVALLNRWQEPLFAPATLWLRDFAPAAVVPLNADMIIAPPADGGDGFADWIEYGYDYAGLFGEDDVLAPGETSRAHTLVLSDPGLAPFAFAARAEFGMVPDLPVIAGRCFIDLNLDGVPQDEEPGWLSGVVFVQLPGGNELIAQPDFLGRWSAPVDQIGLYTLRFLSLSMMPMDPPFTTPHPLTVVLTPGPDGRPQSFLDANFGVAGDLPPTFGEPVRFTGAPVDSLHHGAWNLLDHSLESWSSLSLHVGFSGCEPDQRFTLYAADGFMESEPVQVDLVLVLEEIQDCDAAFEDWRRFDLRPLAERFLSQHGPGELQLNLHQPDGTVHFILMPIYPPD